MTESPRPSARTWAAIAVALAVVGLAAVVVAVTGQQRAPQPPASDAAATASTAPAPSNAPTPLPPGPPSGPGAEPAPPAPVADPVALRIPSIGVSSDLVRLGLRDDGTVEVPPLVEDDRAGWYRRGPAPGARGPAVLLGHVDSAEHGPGVFFELGALTPGAEVQVARADGTVAVFAVDRVARYAKGDFPTLEVYGNTDGAELRLITCGGDFDPAARSYEDNVVAFASLVDERAA
ncbi:class F sortase [Geodermatophilus sp. YIM 151500]|uniref:class F sortase n=1 Tax=Geodermatophilus sp. YIM 151500 TaxID=2984531 RepID=UPI0021E3E1EE|nr:class F sortase [Geodermatophilus sp. YIM 151500]MCV2489994.1 class F sortase [Geodermatophilus sp. YIM 151500]